MSVEMKQNREAGEEDEASARPLFLCRDANSSCFFGGFSSFYMLAEIVPQQMWLLLPVSVFYIHGTGKEFHPLQECL